MLFLQKETACSSNEVIVQEDSAIKLCERKRRGFLQRLSATRKKEINERIVNCIVAIRGKISWKIIRANFLRYLFLHEQIFARNLKTNLFLQQWTARDNGDIESSLSFFPDFDIQRDPFTINVPQAIKMSFCSTRNDPLDRERGRTRDRG